MWSAFQQCSVKILTNSMEAHVPRRYFGICFSVPSKHARRYCRFQPQCACFYEKLCMVLKRSLQPSFLVPAIHGSWQPCTSLRNNSRYLAVSGCPRNTDTQVQLCSGLGTEHPVTAVLETKYSATAVMGTEHPSKSWLRIPRPVTAVLGMGHQTAAVVGTGYSATAIMGTEHRAATVIGHNKRPQLSWYRTFSRSCLWVLIRSSRKHRVDIFPVKKSITIHAEYVVLDTVSIQIFNL